MIAYGPTLRRRQAKLARSVGESPTQVMPSRQPGSECCVNRRRRRPRSVHSGCVGCVIEPRNGYVAGAETVQSVERNTDRAAKRGHARLPGSKSRSRAKGSRRNLGDPAFGQSNSASGLVSRVTPVHTALRNCMRDEGRPFEFGNQVLISSHRKLLSSKAMVVNVAEKSGHDPVRQG